MSSRQKILDGLRSAQQPFADRSIPDAYLPMVPIAERDQPTLTQRFVEEAEKLSCTVHRTSNPSDAIETLLDLLGDAKSVISWDPETIPLPHLADALSAAGVTIARADDPAATIGVSGASAALAATGSLVLASGTGQYRTASLLPPAHIAIVTEDQILPDFESWMAEQHQNNLQEFRDSSNIVLVSGPSKTADIAMELILGMHGPGTLDIILVSDVS